MEDNKVIEALKKAWEFFKSLPILGPLVRIALSRKGMVATLVVGFLLEKLPQLAPIQAEFEVAVAQLVGVVIMGVALILGIAWEDVAAKQNGFVPKG